MAEPDLGHRLIEVGWDQGVLLPPLSWSLVYDPNDPLSSIARSAVRLAKHKLSPPDTAPSHDVAVGAMRPKDRLVVASQACDIVRVPSEEPNVLAMRVFTTDNDRITRAAASNSARHFLLDANRGLVVDATVTVLLEKPVLVGLVPEPGAPHEDARRRFARWIATR